MKIPFGIYVVKTLSLEAYEKKIPKIKSPKDNGYIYESLAKHKILCDRKFIIERKPFTEYTNSAINVIVDTEMYIPNVIVEEYITLEDARKIYPEVFL